MKKSLFLLLLMAAKLAAMSQISLSGYVLDYETNDPLMGAHIVVENTLLRSSSNQKGYFRLNNLRPGTYQLVVTHIGYETYRKQIAIESPETVQINLLRKTILSDEVVISATRAGENTPVSQSTMTNTDLQQFNNGRDIPFVLETLPSVVSTSDAGTGVGYTNLRIRGTDMNRINITVNGIPLNDSESHGVWWVNMPDFITSVDNLQVQRGVGTSTNGAAAFGATLNMQTNRFNENPYAELSSGVGSFNTFRNRICFGSGLLKKNFTFDGRLSKITSDGYIDRAWANLYSHYLTAAYQGKKTVIRAKTFSGTEHTYQAWNGVPSSMLTTHRTYNGTGEYTLPSGDKAYYDNETDNYKQDHYQFFLLNEPLRNTTLQLALHYTKGFGYYEQFKENRKFSDYGLPAIKLPGNYLIQGNDTLYFAGGQIKRTDLIRRKYLDNDFYGMIWSANHQQNNLQLTLGGSWNKYFGDHYGTVIWARFLPQAGMNYRWYDNTGRKRDFNIYAKLHMQLNSRWRLFGDLQFRAINYSIDGIDDDLRNITQQHDFAFINPKFGIMWEPGPNHKFYLSYANANREPNRSNYTDANPLQPLPTEEMLHDVEFGYKYNSSTINLAVGAYYMYYVDQLVLTGKINDVGAPVMTNVPKSYRAGIEAETIFKPAKWVQWSGNLNLSRNIIAELSEYIDDWDNWGSQIENQIQNTYLSFSPGIVASSYFSFNPVNKMNVSLQSKFVGQQYIDNTSSSERKLDPYLVNNLKVQYHIKIPKLPDAEIMLQINNLFNEKYETNAWVYRYFYQGRYESMDGFFPQAGINFMIGVNLSL